MCVLSAFPTHYVDYVTSILPRLCIHDTLQCDMVISKTLKHYKYVLMGYKKMYVNIWRQKQNNQTMLRRLYLRKWSLFICMVYINLSGLYFCMHVVFIGKIRFFKYATCGGNLMFCITHHSNSLWLCNGETVSMQTSLFFTTTVTFCDLLWPSVTFRDEMGTMWHRNILHKSQK